MKTSKIPVVREVAIALQEHPELRAEVMRRYKERGGQLDPASLDIMCHALTGAEDALEMARGGRWTPGRAALRAVRRRLEVLID